MKASEKEYLYNQLKKKMNAIGKFWCMCEVISNIIKCNRSQWSYLGLFAALHHNLDHWWHLGNNLIDFGDFFLIQFFNFCFNLCLKLHNLLFQAFSFDVTVVKLNNRVKNFPWDVQDAI